MSRGRGVGRQAHNELSRSTAQDIDVDLSEDQFDRSSAFGLYPGGIFRPEAQMLLSADVAEQILTGIRLEREFKELNTFLMPKSYKRKAAGEPALSSSSSSSSVGASTSHSHARAHSHHYNTARLPQAEPGDEQYIHKEILRAMRGLPPRKRVKGEDNADGLEHSDDESYDAEGGHNGKENEGEDDEDNQEDEEPEENYDDDYGVDHYASDGDGGGGGSDDGGEASY